MNNNTHARNRRSIWALYTVILLYCIVLYSQVSMGRFDYMRESLNVEFTYGKSTLSSVSMHMATILFILSGVWLLNKVRLNTLGAISLTVLSIYMGLYFLSDISSYGLMTIIHQTTGPMVYFILLGMFLSYEDGVWEKVVKICQIIGPVIIIASLIVTFTFLSSFGGQIGNSPQIVLLGNGFWAMAIAVIGTPNKDRRIKQIFYLFCIGCGLTTAILYGTRSWALQCFLLILTYYYKQSSFKRVNIMYVAVFSFLLYWGYIFIESNYTSNLNYLSDRLLENTRSFQYQEIFSQFGLNDLLFGRGTFGTYHSSLYGDYAYIDNVFMYILLHWGIIPVVCIATLLLVPVSKFLFCRNIQIDFKLRTIIIVMWVLSINGLAIYNTIMFDLRNALIALTLGKCYKDLFAISHSTR